MTDKSKDTGNIKQLIAIAMKSLLKEKKFSKITVGDIALRAELSRQSFYRNFCDKYDVLSFIYKSYIDELQEQYGILSIEKLGYYVVEFFKENGNLFKELGCDFGNPNPFMNFWFDYNRRYIISIIGKNNLTPELESAITFYFHACYFTHFEYVCGNIDGNPEKVTNITLKFMPEILRQFLYKD